MIFGWDLGGAHVKVAVLDEFGRLVRVAQAPCPLWRGLEQLERALESLGATGTQSAVHAVTMTGELVDLFADRCTGVAAIVASFGRVVDAQDTRFFAGDRFLDASAATVHWEDVASANWLATATLVARLVPEALMVDIGSTTTDLAIVAGGGVHTQARHDRERLAREELVYTGVVRTPIMALADVVPFAGEWTSLMAEYFATSGDLYRVTGELDARFDQSETADGHDRSREASLRRLARVVGCDVADAPTQEWERLARWLSHAQAGRIRRAADRALSRGLIGPRAPVVALGVGHFLAARVAASQERACVEFAALLDVPAEERPAANTCGPALAVAELAHGRR